MTFKLVHESFVMEVAYLSNDLILEMSCSSASTSELFFGEPAC